MFNEFEIKKIDQQNMVPVNGILSAEKVFPKEILSEIEKFRLGSIDNLIIHGLPVPHELINTPTEIRDVPIDIFPAYILKSLGNFLGTISPKDIENTIRFRVGPNGTVNEETWHGHYQYKYSVFYCLRGDQAAKTFFISANTLIKNAPKEIASLLLKPFVYISGVPEFSLFNKSNGTYSISPHVYDRSDLEKYIKDLDLPDVVKALEKIIASVDNQQARDAAKYLYNTIKNTDTWISYKPGDIAMYNEASTMRFSPGYTPTTDEQEDRWILSLTIEN